MPWAGSAAPQRGGRAERREPGAARPRRGGVPGTRQAGVAAGQPGARAGGAGEPPGAGLALACRALPNTVQRCQPPARHPEPAAEVKYSRERNAGRGCRAGRVPRHSRRRPSAAAARLRAGPRASPGRGCLPACRPAGRAEAKAPLGAAGRAGAAASGAEGVRPGCPGRRFAPAAVPASSRPATPCGVARSGP